MTDEPRIPPPHPIPTDRLVQASELLSMEEAAALAGISTSTLSRKVKDGIVVPLRRNPLIFHADDLRSLKA